MCDVTKNVSVEEMTDILLNYNRCTPVVIEATTEVKMNKGKKFVLNEQNEYVVVGTKDRVKKTKDKDGNVINEEVVQDDVYDSINEENPYYKNVTCTKFTNGVINFDYENAVKRQQGREGKEPVFEAKERAWGSHVTRAMIEHKGQYYVQIRVNNTYGHEYRNGAEKINYNELKPFITPKKENDSQGVDKEVIVRDIKLDGSIDSITLDKVKYVIEK